jgi:thiamine-phosphate pyrophosphorylase
VLDAGDVAAFQLRLKDASDDAIRRAVEALMPKVQARNVAFLLDDRPDLAAALGCDGVHLDVARDAYAEARQIMGGARMIGVSAGSSRHDAIEAADAGADYVSFGPFFPSTTKTAEVMADIEIVRWWAEIMEVPCVAVGGLTPANCRPLVEAGADFVAVSGGVWGHAEGAAAAVKAFNRMFAGA